MTTITRIKRALLASLLGIAAFALPLAASAVTLTFDDAASLGAYSDLTFSGSAYIWDTAGHESVLTNPLGTHFTTEDVLCVSSACVGSVDITFSSDMDFVSVAVLSGPGSDVVSADASLEAFDAAGNSLGVSFAGSGVQYDTLSISAVGIASIRLTGGSAVEVFDDLTYESGQEPPHMPEPGAALLFGIGITSVMLRKRIR